MDSAVISTNLSHSNKISVNEMLPTMKRTNTNSLENENLWSKISDKLLTKGFSKSLNHSTPNRKKTDSKNDTIKNRSIKSVIEYTALPFHKTLSNTKIKMVNLNKISSKIPRFVVAPDGYIPNSKVREKYPSIYNWDPPSKKKRDEKNLDDEEFIKQILSKHLEPDKIKAVKKRFERRVSMIANKIRYDPPKSDLVAIQNEVMNNFNFELEMVASEPVSEKEKVKKVKKKKTLPIVAKQFQRSAQIQKSSKAPSLFDDTDRKMTDSMMDHDEYNPTSHSIEDIDIDILDTLAKQIEEADKAGITVNEKITERLNRDRQYRMTDEELEKCLKLLEQLYDSKKDMYRDIMKALNQNLDSLSTLDKVLKSRQKRLEFLNTFTDPRHLFNYLLFFYHNRSELLDQLQDVLMGATSVGMKQLTMFCGEQYKIKEFFTEFVAVKNYAFSILSTKIGSEKDRIMILEKSLRDGVIDEEIVFNIFMSSKEDAERFFQYIPECRLKEMKTIIENMKAIKDLQESITVKMNSKRLRSSTLSTDSKITNTMSLAPKRSVKIATPATITLPPLPDYNEFSWKNMMSQYITQMLANISPTSKTDNDQSLAYVDNADLLELIKELSFLHAEVMRLLNVYLNNDMASAKKLLEGLIAEDELAYNALIELIGEKEAMQIIKSLRLKQAKVIEKIIECSGNAQQMSDAKTFLRSMMHYLPASLTANLNTWLDAGRVTASDINKAVKQLNKKPLDRELFHVTIESSEEEEKLFDEMQTVFFDKVDKRSRASITTKHFSKAEFEETTKGPLRRGSLMHGKFEYDYRDLVERDEPAEGSISQQFTSTKDEPVMEFTKSSITTVELTDNQKSLTESFLTYKGSLPIDDHVSTRTDEQQMVEYGICQEICNISWFTVEPTFNYGEMLLKLVDLIANTDNIQDILEMQASIITITQYSTDVESKNVIANKIFQQVACLLEEDDADQLKWHFKLSALSSEDELTEMAAKKTEDAKEGFISKIHADKVLVSDINKSLAESILVSYEKHMKIEKLINVLGKLEVKQADELKKVIQNKKYICPLFVPEFNAQINVVRDIGIDYYEPHELVGTKPEVIMRKEYEEKKRTKIISNILERLPSKATMAKLSHDAYWDRASQSSHIKDAATVHSDAQSMSLKDKLGSDSTDVISAESSLAIEHSVSDKSSHKDSSDGSKLSIQPHLVVFKRVSEASVMSFKDAISVTQLKQKGDILTAEYVDEDIIIRDDVPIPYEIGVIKPYPPRKPRRIKSKDPYFDFHSLYGPTSYYLPYIAPEIRIRGRSREESFPGYGPTDHQDNLVYDNVNKMINKVGKTSQEDASILSNSRFIRRPSRVPLCDWIKLGAPRMAANMSIADKAYKIDNSKCRFHHLTKLRLHKYGVSASKYLERCDMVEFIGKANSATKYEMMKSKMDSKISDSSASLLETF